MTHTRSDIRSQTYVNDEIDLINPSALGLSRVDY